LKVLEPARPQGIVPTRCEEASAKIGMGLIALQASD
jgi:hypothetical protein